MPSKVYKGIWISCDKEQGGGREFGKQQRLLDGNSILGTSVSLCTVED